MCKRRYVGIHFIPDTSGSMCVTTEVQGNLQLRGEQERRAQFNSYGPEYVHFTAPHFANIITANSAMETLM